MDTDNRPIDPDWTRQALCGGLAYVDPELADRFFELPIDPMVERFCAVCPVAYECYVTGSSASHGVWGGVSALDIPPHLSMLRPVTKRHQSSFGSLSRDRRRAIRREIKAGTSYADIAVQYGATVIQIVGIREAMVKRGEIPAWRSGDDQRHDNDDQIVA